jgi:rod shape-determining protein MreC
MRNILLLFVRNGGFVSFVLAEAFCFWVILQYNDTQKAIFTHTSGIFAGNMLEKQQQLTDYLNLNTRVDSLLRENERLLAQVANARRLQMPYRDTFYTVLFDTINPVDSIRRKVIRPSYRFTAARVVGNSIHSANNWLMINRGSADSLRSNMAVITPKGLVGIVRHVDAHFAMVMSVLHRQTRISVSLPRQGNPFGQLIWEGGDPTIMTLRYIPKHFNIQPGDPVETSGLSDMFPKGILVGWVADKPEKDPENPYFFLIKVRLSQDVSLVNDVYVVNNIFQTEMQQVQQKAKNEQ